MYLADRDIRGLLPTMDVKTDNEEFPFLPDQQVQPCSIDLRLSNVFWIPTKRTTVDLRRPQLLEISPRHYWKRVVLKRGECLTIKPKELLLARVYESFTMPAEYAGKIGGRSSFARMGLMVHCSADLINPGFRGHVPMQLVNLSHNPIKVFPYLPICQLHLVKLTSIPQKLYGEVELQSKYMDDDGGPSYWWRDKRVKQLQQAMGEVDIAATIQNEVIRLIGDQDIEVFERLEELVAKMPHASFENAEALLENFSRSEDRRRFWLKLLRGGITALFPLMLSVSLGSMVEQPIGFWHKVFWIATAISLPLSFVAFRTELGGFLGNKELRQIKRGQEAQKILNHTIT